MMVKGRPHPTWRNNTDSKIRKHKQMEHFNWWNKGVGEKKGDRDLVKSNQNHGKTTLSWGKKLKANSSIYRRSLLRSAFEVSAYLTNAQY